MSDHATLREWLDRYEAAWRGNDAELIRALFTDDATYRWHPWDTSDDVAHGADAIVAGWLDEPDDPAGWELTGDGRCRDFVEYYMRGPAREEGVR